MSPASRSRVTPDGLFDEPIATTPLPNGEELRIALTAYRSSAYLHCQQWYRGRSGKWRRGGNRGDNRNNLSVPVFLLPWLLDALRSAEATAIANGLLSPADYDGTALEVPPELAVRHAHAQGP